MRLPTQTQLHLLAVASEELRQAKLWLMAQPLGRADGLGLLELDMPDEFGGIILRIKGRAVAAQGLLIEDADDAAGSDDRTTLRLAVRAVADQTLQPFARGPLAKTLGDHSALENHQGATGDGRSIHARSTQAKATR